MSDDRIEALVAVMLAGDRPLAEEEVQALGRAYADMSPQEQTHFRITLEPVLAKWAQRPAQTHPLSGSTDATKFVESSDRESDFPEDDWHNTEEFYNQLLGP